MFNTKRWAYNFLIFMVFLVQQQCGSTAEDFLADITLEADDIIPIHQATTESNFRKTNFYQDSETYDEIGLQSTGVDAQKFNNGAIYHEVTFNENNNQLQPRKNEDEKSSNGDDNIFSVYSSASESNGFKDWVTNHKKLAHSTFEKHKTHHHNYRRNGHKHHKKSFSKYKKHEHLREKEKLNMHNVYNPKPYYEGQVSYYGNSDISDSMSFNSPTKIRNHRYKHHQQHHQYRDPDHSLHHISRIPEYNPNSKWPHLSRVQYQLYEDEREDELPPYIKKYNRRNKQLLDLLEGTMPPPTTPPQYSKIMLNKKRERNQRRYHNHKNSKWIMEDLFEEQKANPNNPNKEDDQYVNDSASSVTSSNPPIKDSEDDELKLIHRNELPGDNISVSQEDDVEEENTDKKTEEESQRKKSKLSPELDDNVGTTSVSISRPHDELKVSPKANQFVYHRVASSRLTGIVGTGGAGGTRKQRLPFVAITDRRLETSKMRQKDFEQNHLPLP